MAVPNPTSYSDFCVYHFFLNLLNNFWCLKLLGHGCSKPDLMFNVFSFFFFFKFFFLLCICRITLDTKSCLAMALLNSTSCLNYFFHLIFFFFCFFFLCALNKQFFTSKITQPWPFLTRPHLQIFILFFSFGALIEQFLMRLGQSHYKLDLMLYFFCFSKFSYIR